MLNKYYIALAVSLVLSSDGFSVTRISSFSGKQVCHTVSSNDSTITMRKQKASDKRTRRMQRSSQLLENTESLSRQGNGPLTPMSTGQWKHKSLSSSRALLGNTDTSGGRGRSRKRSAIYSNLASYHTQFLELLTAEFLAEVSLIRVLCHWITSVLPGCRLFTGGIIFCIVLDKKNIWLFRVGNSHK